MKNIAISGIILLVSFSSCDNGEKPIIWGEYFRFVTSEDVDLFMGYPEYSTDKVSYYGERDRVLGFQFVDTLDYGYRFCLANHFQYVESYIDYGNGDIDTLTVSWSPPETSIYQVYSGSNGVSFTNIDWVKIHFNKILVADWDFVNNPELSKTIIQRNNLYRRGYPDYDPIVITLPKDPDCDELD